MTAFFLSLSSILVCSHGHLENKNQPALSSAESLPQAEDKASSPASCFGKEWWSGMWGLLWVLGFPVTGKSLKMLTCETYGSKEPLQTLLSLNKVQKSFRRADHVYKKQGIRQVGRKPLRATELSTSSCLTPGVKWSKVGKRKRKKPVFLLAGSSPAPYDVTPGLRHSLRWKVASWRRSCRSS